MNIIFFGSDNFAVAALKALIASGRKVSCVVTQPDRKKGRGLSLAPTPVKAVAKQLLLKIYEPTQINCPEAIKFLKTLKPDLFVVIAYGQLLSQEILDIPKIFSVNIHASLLPKYRGAAPINWALINGELTSGVTVIKMVKKMDAGPIIKQREVDINNDDTSITLEDKLSQVASGLLIDSLESIENNDYKLTLQEESKASFAPRLKKADGLINWNKPAQDIYNLIRGCLGWPGAFTYYKGKLLKIYKAQVCLLRSGVFRAGEIIKVNKQGIIVSTGKDNLLIEELQIESKKRMKVDEFILGHKVFAGDILGKNDCIKKHPCYN